MQRREVGEEKAGVCSGGVTRAQGVGVHVRAGVSWDGWLGTGRGESGGGRV